MHRRLPTVYGGSTRRSFGDLLFEVTYEMCYVPCSTMGRGTRTEKFRSRSSG